MSEFWKNLQTSAAKALLSIKAVQLRPDKLFQWASGWLSPIYCDNRKSLSHVKQRKVIMGALEHFHMEHFSDAEIIVGTATAGIPWGIMLADRSDLPFAYVRSKPKDHGLENLIEGDIEMIKGKKVLVIEDLVSTGGSSMDAVNAIRYEGGEVIGMLAIFTYGFPQAEKLFKEADCPLYAVTNYETLLPAAVEGKQITPDQEEILKLWRENPSEWGRAPKE